MTYTPGAPRIHTIGLRRNRFTWETRVTETRDGLPDPSMYPPTFRRLTHDGAIQAARRYINRQEAAEAHRNAWTDV